jgi:hypothetical protein
MITHDHYIAFNAIPSLIDWLGVLFYYSWHYGGLFDLASIIFEQHKEFILKIIEEKLPPNLEESKLIYTACHALAWTISYKQEDSIRFATALDRYFERSENRSTKKSIAVQLAIGFADHSTKTESKWIEIILTEFSDLLNPSERIQVLAKYYSSNAEKLDEDWQQFKQAIIEYFSALKVSDPLLAKYEKSKLFNVILGPVLNCLEKKLFKNANDIITEFYGIEPLNRIVKDQLYLISNYNYGPLYASPKDRLCFEGKVPEDFVKLIMQTNRFLSSTVTLNNFAGFKIEKPKRQGVPVLAEGPSFEDLLNEHYQFEKLSQFSFDTIDSMIIAPGLQHPIQSMMIKELDFTLPITASFENPKPKRKIKKVLLWCYGTTTSELEISLTEKIFSQAGFEVEAINILKTNRDDFITKYKSSEYDLIWVGTHGNYNHFLPHLSKIDIHPAGEIELSELIGLTPSKNGQRMLFLNICDGATASTLNAVYDIGLGASLCNGNQAVLSHIWPVKIETSFIYGVLYAHFLNVGDDFFKAYENVVKAFLRGKEYIREVLRSYCMLEEKLERYIDSLEDDIEKNIYYWGSGVYYQ